MELDTELCSTCNADIADFHCQECGTPECMRCRARYEVVNNPPALCWMCQAEADREWMQGDLSKPRRIGPRQEVSHA
jgi:predicted amidophosphoribosyltransferase